MRSTRTLRRVALAAILSVSFLFQGTWALAGTTGGIAGVVHDDQGAPIAGASVTAASPSQTATTTTDAQGHFLFLTLAPDTYTVSVQKDGYQSISQAGETVFADQTQQLVMIAPRALRVIATQQTTAASLVRAGVGGDLYSVSAAQQQATAALGGGGNLNSAYSAISSVPGLYVPTGGMGWNQMVVIHGELPWTTGFEYDGVPVNRAFDQYNSSTESSLGLQELQVYTGGGPVSVSSNGVSGFINQVIKTGTYPGFASLEGGIATEAYYHEAKFEAGGSTPDRNFSYYVGISGYNQAFRNVDQQNGGSLATPGSAYAAYSPLFADFDTATGQGVLNLCIPNTGLFGGVAGAGAGAYAGSYGANGGFPGTAYTYGDCLSYAGPYAGTQSFNTDRENVVNLHLAVPRRDGQRDDFQLLWSDSAMQTFFNNSPIDNGPGVAQYTLNNTGNPYVAGVNYPSYADATTYNLPFGTQVNTGAGGAGSGLPYQLYYQPNSPRFRPFYGQTPSNTQDLYHNDVGIGKLQWTHPFTDNAYVRIYAYSMFTDWNEDGPHSTFGYDFGTGSPVAPDYDLITHTGGGSVTFADQFNDQNLVQLTANYITATTSRWNNTG
ncbi:MAG TPA: carboxypeptidase regulatory-like domain-containing protein, partial [Candidatus Tyrphobacter sp.]